MGTETTITYICDIGGETSTEPDGWVSFQLTASPLRGVDPGIALGFPTMLACPNHVQHVVNVITAGLGAIPPAPGASLPGAPSNVAAAIDEDGKVTVTWNPPAADGGSPVTGYVVRSIPGDVVARPMPVTSATVESLTPGVSYAFTVAAINAVGQGPASRQSAAVDIPNPAPAP